jgi:hypothetical protein
MMSLNLLQLLVNKDFSILDYNDSKIFIWIIILNS